MSPMCAVEGYYASPETWELIPYSATWALAPGMGEESRTRDGLTQLLVWRTKLTQIKVPCFFFFSPV